MQSMPGESGDSPLRTFASLDQNLRRERRVFTTVIALLVCATLAAAVLAVWTRLAASLRSEEEAARQYEQAIADGILDRHNAVSISALILSLRANGALPTRLTPVDHPCERSLASSVEPVLQASCDEAMQVVSGALGNASIEMVLVSDGSVYTWRPPPVAAGTPRQPADYATLVPTILARFGNAPIPPHADTREMRVLWFSGAALGRQTKEMIAASVVTRAGAPYAIVLTTLDPARIYAETGPDDALVELILLDTEGKPVIGAISPSEAARINARLENRPDGVFHWIPSYGWALRPLTPISEFGRPLYVLPYRLQLSAMRNELLLIVAVAATLIGLLGSMYRYWNYRFLGRVYAEAHRALESETLNHLLVHATPVGLCVVRRRQLDIIVANPIARNMLGLAPQATRLPDSLREEFGTREAHRGVPPVGDPPAGPAVSQFSFTMKRAEGDGDVHLEVTYAPATLDREDVFFCAMTDVTEYHRAEQILTEAQATSEAAAKAKIAFFASMSHEVRTPLSSLVGNLELIGLGPLAPEQQARVNAMQVSAMGLLQIVNDMLDFSKMDVGELGLVEEWASIADLLDSIAMAHAPLAVEKGLQFYVVFERNIPSRLRFDAIRVSQIVSNLLSNAFKFTNSGKIVLQAQWVDERLQLAVIDSGIGMAADLRERLFQPFMQGTSNRVAKARGTGLGLSICAQLCELMKGRIEVESTVGVGTRVSVTLPLEPSPTDRQTAEWTLPCIRPAVLCRAPEYQTWLRNLFDPARTAVTMVTDMKTAIDPAAHEFLLVTDEYPADNVLAWWRTPRTIIWATQAGPLVPEQRSDGSTEVAVYSLAGLRTATQRIDRAARHLPAESAGGAVSATVVARPARPLSVLIAEDNLLNRGLLRDQLVTLGAHVIEATCGEEAVALFAREPADVVFTDIDMPGMNGFELLEKLREQDPSIPVFAVSASALPEDVAEGRARGFKDYLTKPVPLAVLAAALDAAGQRFVTVPASPVAAHTPAPDTPVADVPLVSADYAQAFVEQTRADMSDLAAAVSARSVTQLRKWLHRVTGGLSMLGASKLLEQCRQLHARLRSSPEWSDAIEQQALTIGDVLNEMRTQLIEAQPATGDECTDTASLEASSVPPGKPDPAS